MVFGGTMKSPTLGLSNNNILLENNNSTTTTIIAVGGIAVLPRVAGEGVEEGPLHLRKCSQTTGVIRSD